MKVSLISTVKNEGDNLQILLDSILNQTMLPDEVVISDGGSTDNTRQILEEYKQWLPLKIVDAPGSNISEGRNKAIAVASGPIIAATDSGVVLSPQWLENLVRPLNAGDATIVAGWFEADPYTDFEVVMGSTVLPTLDDVDSATFLPSSRSVAFLKSAWESIGGYPEWLDFGEDIVFDKAMRKQFGAFAFADGAVAYFRPRGSLRSYFRQYYCYARGDGKANLWPLRHLIRYATYLVALPFILRLIWNEKWQGWLLLVLGVGAYSHRPSVRLWENTWGWRPYTRARAFGLIPIIRFVGDLAKMVGYPVGLLWRLRNRHSIPD
jgi:glycosyltransferase involved in cell wall biosynthesis